MRSRLMPEVARNGTPGASLLRNRGPVRGARAAALPGRAQPGPGQRLPVVETGRLHGRRPRTEVAAGPCVEPGVPVVDAKQAAVADRHPADAVEHLRAGHLRGPAAPALDGRLSANRFRCIDLQPASWVTFEPRIALGRHETPRMASLYESDRASMKPQAMFQAGERTVTPVGNPTRGAISGKSGVGALAGVPYIFARAHFEAETLSDEPAGTIHIRSDGRAEDESALRIVPHAPVATRRAYR